MKPANIISLLVFIALVAAAAWTGASFEPGSWYESIEKPGWTPPDWLFGPVWSVLYLLIAIAGWLVWRDGGGHFSGPLLLWSLQLILNASWSWIFFGLNRPATGFFIILMLLLVILLFILRSRNRIASFLFVPYAIWVGFASMLNLEIVRLNM